MLLNVLPLVAGKKTIGILALQGDYYDHQQHFLALKQSVKLIKTPHDLTYIDALVIPGGESSAMIYLLKRKQLWHPLEILFKQDIPVWGTCAGAILLSHKVLPEPQDCFSLIDIDIRRNAYGTQKNSFEAVLSIPVLDGKVIPSLFIRAPLITRCGKSCTILGYWKKKPVIVQEKVCMVSTFHTELESNHKLHIFFLQRFVYKK